MKGLALSLIRFYQHSISPGRPPSCRFQPSCSCYGYEAIATYGLLRGSWLTLWRLARCHPWHNGGLDPVP